MSEEPIVNMTEAILVCVAEQVQGDHDAAVEIFAHLSCLLAMTGKIEPEELRERFERVLESYTRVVTVLATPGGEA